MTALAPDIWDTMHPRLAEALAIVLILTHFMLAVYMMWDNHHQFILHPYERSALLHPQNYRSNLNTSKIFLEAQHWARGLDYAQRAIRIHPNRATALMNAGTAAAGLKSWRMSHAYFSRAFRVYPAKQVAVNLLALSRALGRRQEAELLQAAIPWLRADIMPREPTT